MLAVRITTAPKPVLSSIVSLGKGEAIVGSVLCDDVLVVGKDRLKRQAGALSAPSMRLVDAGLKVALARS